MTPVRAPGRGRCSRPAVALTLALLLVLTAPSVASALPSEHPFEVEPGSFHVAPSTNHAGAHENLTTTFNFAHTAAGRTFDDLKTTIVNLPPGFVGSNTAVPTCTFAQLVGKNAGEPECPPASQVGIIKLDLTIRNVPVMSTFSVYNMQITTPGVAAQLGFDAFIVDQLLNVNVRPNDLGLTVTGPEIQETGEPHDISVTIWGVPWSHEHDAERGISCYERGVEGVAECGNKAGEEVSGSPRPYLATPTSCGGPLPATMSANSWELSGSWSQALTEVTPIVNCEGVPFNPSIEVQPTTSTAESPSGLNLSLVVPQSWDSAEVTATSALKDARVTLPLGYTVNPSAGSGLAACTPEQLERETSSSPPGTGCPPESKLGTVSIETPLLTEAIAGNVYLAKPYDNPFDSLLALYVVAKSPARGILVKVSGKVEPDPVTGQLVTTFLNNPQVPFSRFLFSFRQGATSPLVSPQTCGSYTVLTELTPWSAPTEPRALRESLQIERGVQGGPCPSGVPPFGPTVLAGTQSNAAGSYSPFYLRIARQDGEQELTGFSTIMPPGLTGNLTGIPFCPDAAIEAAKQRTGAQEEAEPSCPASSRIGHSLVGAGVGAILAQTPGSLYLAGPYHGAPLSLVSVTSAKVGPFDLGTVVIRFALRINPITAQVEVDATGSDPIPHIIKGIVTHVRDIRAYIDRPQFIINPTSCEHLQIQNTITGAGQDPSNPADQRAVSVTSPFQAANCASLRFEPSFGVTTTGKTSKADGAGLNVKLSMPGPLGTQANIHQVKVELPVQLPSRLTTLQKACTKAQFDANPAGCPAASVVGHARAITPILPVPLEGPAYFVSNGGEAFPNLIVVLQGYGVTIDLVGDTFISKSGITSSTFKTVPDQPVQSFELTLPQGPFSALTANGNLCALTKTVTVKKKATVRTRGHKLTITRRVKQTIPATLSMPTEFVAQNGTTLHQTTTVSVTGCPKARPARKSKAKKRAKPGRKR